MILFYTTLKRILRDKMYLVSMLIVPVFFITMIVVLGGRSSADLSRVGVTDLDHTSLSQMLTERLAERAEVVNFDQEAGKEAVLAGSIDYYLVIPADFTRQIIANENPLLESYGIVEDEQTIPLQIYLNNLVNGLKTIGAAAEGDEQAFYQGLGHYLEGPFQLKMTATDQAYKPTDMTQDSLGFLVMSMLFFSTSVVNEILRDKRRRTMQRILAAPVSLKQYMLEHLLSFLLLSQLQILGVFAMMGFVFQLSFGASFLRIYLVLFLFSIVCVSFGIAITSLSKDSHQASVLASTLITPMAMLGGCFWSRELMPQLLQKISYFVPVTWVLKATGKVLYGGTLAEIRDEILLLMLFSAIFFLLGTWRKADLKLGRANK